MIEVITFLAAVSLAYIVGHAIGWVDAMNAFGFKKKEEKKVAKAECTDYSHLKKVAIQKGLYNPATMRARELEDGLRVYDSEIKDDEYFIEKDSK